MESNTMLIFIAEKVCGEISKKGKGNSCILHNLLEKVREIQKVGSLLLDKSKVDKILVSKGRIATLPQLSYLTRLLSSVVDSIRKYNKYIHTYISYLTLYLICT